MIFLHGWPEIGLVWRGQMEHFSALGWRCIAPDMRGYGDSSRPGSTSAYTVRELVADMVELHDALGSTPAIWVGHDWGSAVAWSMASHHAGRCRGVVNLCVPYLARGFALPNLVPLVDRDVYPEARFPVGQWDYWLFYRQHFSRASREFEVDVIGTLAMLYRRAPTRQPRTPAFTAHIRLQDGWFGAAHRPPHTSQEETLLSQEDFDRFAAAFMKTGFSGADAWYMNDEANIAYAAEAPNFGRLSVPALFIHATNDLVCDTTGSRLAEPMREDCESLSEMTIEGGHEIMLEQPGKVSKAISDWLASQPFF
ncbi:alpha/beta hydrolase [Acidimangrovimonas sediminis]|uniref:alpha/beta hydrolase n=1 Tax=Acidimangrovimonas sediminis TaxID=2056283 RepID=UPI000C7F89FB|nr:alpha/beta hydrolase [Acidimangrovimonas sediminis]